MSDLLSVIGLFIAGMAAGAINSIAGGGTLLSFPSLVAFGEPEIIANATNTAALWPGSLSGALGYRKDTPVDRGLLLSLAFPSLIGGILGAAILVATAPDVFNHVVPFLILFATLMLASQGFINRKLRGGGSSNGERLTTLGRVWGALFQLFVATYGGYFGAGIGILMLGSFSIMGLRDIHKMNALKTPLAAIINVTAFVFFAFKGLVAWPLALLMMVGAIIGGYGGARLAKHVNQRAVRWGIVVAGLLVSAWFFMKTF